MNERRRGGSHKGLLLLIPAAEVFAVAGVGMGHPHRFGGGRTPDERGEFRLPPRIEWMLETWHTRAHGQEQAAESQTV